ncbi:MAG: hypothetical protein AAGG75_23155 [Bacteroidota bacterium]
MEKDKQQWIDRVLGSLEGSQRAQPRPELFTKIETELFDSEQDIILMPQLRMIAAAVALLVLVNIGLLSQYDQKNGQDSATVVNTSALDRPLLSNYKLYE